MKYRIRTDRYNGTIWYYVQQRCCLLFWKTIYKTVHRTDTKKIYDDLTQLEEAYSKDRLESYSPCDQNAPKKE